MFKKGDPRINRKGRPRKADMLRAALLEKWDAPLLNKDGKPAQVNPATGKPLTYGESVIERLYRDPKQAPELLNRAFGKVKDEIEHTSEVLVIAAKPEDWTHPPSVPLIDVHGDEGDDE